MSKYKNYADEKSAKIIIIIIMYLKGTFNFKYTIEFKKS